MWRLQLQLDAINISDVASDILNRQCADCGDRYYKNTGSAAVEIPRSETEGSLKDFNKTFERTLRKIPRWGREKNTKKWSENERRRDTAIFWGSWGRVLALPVRPAVSSFLDPQIRIRRSFFLSILFFVDWTYLFKLRLWVALFKSQEWGWWCGAGKQQCYIIQVDILSIVSVTVLVRNFRFFNGQYFIY